MRGRGRGKAKAKAKAKPKAKGKARAAAKPKAVPRSVRVGAVAGGIRGLRFAGPSPVKRKLCGKQAEKREST